MDTPEFDIEPAYNCADIYERFAEGEFTRFGICTEQFKYCAVLFGNFNPDMEMEGHVSLESTGYEPWKWNPEMKDFHMPPRLLLEYTGWHGTAQRKGADAAVHWEKEPPASDLASVLREELRRKLVSLIANPPPPRAEEHS